MAKKKYKPIPGGYVALPWNMLNHKAYIKLPPTAKGILPYFLGKVKIPCTDPQYYYVEYSLTYKEATHLGCARRSFSRVIETLMAHGFIEPVHWGQKNSSIFRLSRKWEKYGTAAFEPISWTEFRLAQVCKPVQNWHRTGDKNEPDEGEKEKQVGQK